MWQTGAVDRLVCTVFVRVCVAAPKCHDGGAQGWLSWGGWGLLNTRKVLFLLSL